MFLVFKSETLKCIPDASTKTKKYLKNPHGRFMGPQTSLCNL
jgi:hypothetical protein